MPVVAAACKIQPLLILIRDSLKIVGYLNKTVFTFLPLVLIIKWSDLRYWMLLMNGFH